MVSSFLGSPLWGCRECNQITSSSSKALSSDVKEGLLGPLANHLMRLPIALLSRSFEEKRKG